MYEVISTLIKAAKLHSANVPGRLSNS